MKGYEALIEEHDVDVVTFPTFIPDGSPGGFRIIMQSQPVDLKGNGVKSPFVASDAGEIKDPS